MEYVLDVSKWRCGNGGPFSMGKGFTRMLNPEGYMCCLGQFALQAGVSQTQLLNKGHPANLRYSYDESFCIAPYDDKGDTFNTDLAGTLMKINDMEETTPKEKIERICSVLESEGHTLKVINDGILEAKE